MQNIALDLKLHNGDTDFENLIRFISLLLFSIRPLSSYAIKSTIVCNIRLILNFFCL